MPARELGRRVVSGRTFYILGLIALAALVWMVCIPNSQLVLQLGSIPMVGSLFGALLKVFLDVNADERARMVQHLEHAFALGSSSHMANVAFDKHVVFCEDYAKELRATMETVFNQGPAKLVLEHAVKLGRLRQVQSLWLTPEVEGPLEKIEAALQTMGHSQHRVDADKFLAGEERQAEIELINDCFRSILGENLVGKPREGSKLNKELAISNVVRGLGRVLGVDDLTRLRLRIVSRSVNPTVEW